MRLHIDLIQIMSNVKGKNGCNIVREGSVTFGMNLKGGIDEVEYEKFILISMIPLLHDI